MPTPFLNIASYRFVTLTVAELPQLRSELLEKMLAAELKGTILLSSEGINLFLAGTPNDINVFKQFLNRYPAFENLTYKESHSDHKPFTRTLVRIKKEIISMGCPDIEPEKKTAPHVSPEKLKQWYDEGRDMIVLDTRNDYEIDLGTFDQAVNLNIQSFRDFPQAIDQLSDSDKQKPIVTFCTGGVRCEKAAELMLRKGFKEVYQLDGGILNYFEKCQNSHYNGECFVFDKRVALNSDLQETPTEQCFSCRMPLTNTQDNSCPHCHANPAGKRTE